jgi:hypothetical protein
MKSSTPLVGVFGFAFAGALARLHILRKIDLVWVMPQGAEVQAKSEIMDMIRNHRDEQILVVHPACRHMVKAELDHLPDNVTLIVHENPFTLDGIDAGT